MDRPHAAAHPTPLSSVLLRSCERSSVNVRPGRSCTAGEALVVAADTRVARWLGAVFLLQFLTSLIGGLLSAALLSGDTSQMLDDVATHPGQLRASILLQLVTAVALVALTALMYAELHAVNRQAALVAYGLWLAEAATLAISVLGLYAVLALSTAKDLAGGGAREGLASTALGFAQHAGDIDMLFFCAGAVVWYALLVRARVVPQLLAWWGLLSVLPVAVATLMLLWDRNSSPSAALYAAYVPFELVIGLWLVVRGAHDVATPDAPATAGSPRG
jgi:Domain of unknown function (DUF4386)